MQDPSYYCKYGILLLSGAVLLGMLGLTWGKGAKAADQTVTAQPTIDFNRQIRPILSANCFACHGPDDKQRKAKLRLDTKEGAFADLRGGGKAIVPGKPEQSELIDRITCDEPERVMPPARSGKRLTPEQIALLRLWVEQGAPWAEHWAFIPPKIPETPKIRDVSWPRNLIDYFILARLEAEGLKPSPEADKTTLIRRVTLDLTGLPPTLEEVDAFLHDTTPDAYEKVVDRLLQSPRYGEHMARYWLDAVRYADTHGMHFDNYREIWPYRDWVIRAFNDNKPFNRFLVEQLAGDLLPNPTVEQLVGTGYLRCIMTTNEGGTIEEEAYVRNVVDCTDTNGIVLMGLTVGCARCHDHKFDPISMKDYYQLFAFFNSIDGSPLDGNRPRHPPILTLPNPKQTVALEQARSKVAAARQDIANALAKVKADKSFETLPALAPTPEGDDKDPKQGEPQRADFVWIDDELPEGAVPSPRSGWNFVTQPEHPVYSGSKSFRQSDPGLSQHRFIAARPKLIVGAGDSLYAYVYLDPANPPKAIMLRWNSGHEVLGWRHDAYWGEKVIDFGAAETAKAVRMGPLPRAGEWVRLEVDTNKVSIRPTMALNGWGFVQFGGTVYWDRAGLRTMVPQATDAFDTFSAWEKAHQASEGIGLARPLRDWINFPLSRRTSEQHQQLRDYFVENAWTKTRPTFGPLHKRFRAAQADLERIEKQMPATLIYKEMKQPRPAYILKRGEYDQKGERVARDTPAFLPPFPATAPRDRLGFAQWLLAPDHPLTARVAVNRFWQQCFGTGLVKTAEDFGTRGEPPSHPELLDWLAIHFMGRDREKDPGWDVKRLMRLIVTSSTYRQSSKASRELLAKDASNRLLARGPRFRLDAEVLRDQALYAGGLLVEKLGGPSVKPPQPPGLWEAVAFPSSDTARFIADTGRDKVHRRSLYTFWKRTSSPPQMAICDAPSREACVVRRERTNTPLQALLLMNETQFMEAARALAERTMKQGGTATRQRIHFLFRLCTARQPDEKELAELAAAYQEFLATYQRDQTGAKKLISLGESKPDAKLDPGELAAWTMLANLVLNLDEVLNKG